ncbi:MAG TPA: hypothetical protein VKA27_06295 [Sunxiuqinia sp.]|nr:hypothetical protein [Sunxiuqinia sp.]
MKQLLTIVLGSFLSIGVSAQQPDSLSIKHSNGKNGPKIIQMDGIVTDGFNYWNEKFSGHWSGIYFGFNGLAKADYSMYDADDAGFLDVNLWRSTVVNLNLLQFSKGLQHNRNTIGVVTGLGMEVQTYFLDRNTSIEKGENRIEPVHLFYDSNQKSKLSSFYLSVPFLVEFQIPVSNYGNRFYISAGVVANKRLSTQTKVKYRKNNKKEKLKTPDDYYMNDIRFSGTIKIGYRWINLYATYDLQQLFQDSRGPEVFPYSFGVALISF